MTTFGFRGEALFSVSVCSQLNITSKTEQQNCAIKANYKDGKLHGPMKKTAGVRGTSIRAENLFFENATKRNAVNKTTETKKITEIITNYALLNTGVSITLKKVRITTFATLNVAARRNETTCTYCVEKHCQSKH